MKTGQDVKVGGLPFRVCIWLIRNPGGRLFSAQISRIFNVPVERVSMTLKTAYEAGWLDKGMHGSRVYYLAGPKLEDL